MKVLQVNVVYEKGSTGKIVYDIHNELLEEGIKSVVCYGRGLKIDKPNVYKTSSEIMAKINVLRGRITGMQYSGAYISTNKLINIIKKEKPDIVHLHCINGNFVNIYRILGYLKQNKISTVLTLHAEFMYTGGCGYSLDCDAWKNKTGCERCPNLWESSNSYFFDRTHKSWINMKIAFDKFYSLIVVSVSPWLMERAMQSTILANKIHKTVLNGIDTKNVFHVQDFDYLKIKHGITNEKILLHVTANFKSDIKGGKYIREIATRLMGQNIKIIVVGNKEKSIDLPTNIIDVGRVEEQKELAAYYSMADCTVITSKRETFSMVCAESLSCGTPVVGFKAGAPEQISLSEYSEFVEYGDVDNLERIIYIWLNKGNDVKKNISEKAGKIYSKEQMCKQYKKIYVDLKQV